MIGSLNRLPFIGEVFYGKLKSSPSNTKRMVIVYRNTVAALMLMVCDEAINMNDYSETELLAAINSTDISPDTCHFPTFNMDVEPNIVKQNTQEKELC